MANLLSKLKDTLQLHSERHKNRPFLEATMAAAALVASADGTVSFSERYSVDQMLEQLDQLKVFDPHQAVDLFNSYVESLRDSQEEGRARALAAVAAISEDREAAKMMVRISAAISRADGNFSLVEREEIEAICEALGLSRADCDF